MPKYISKEDLARAREMDLLTYKQTYDPGDLKKIKDGYYQLRSHESLKINYHDGKWLWNWWSVGIGGRSALDYLMNVENMKLQDAVEHLLGNVAITIPVKAAPPEKPMETKGLYIPEVSRNEEKIYSYLCDERGIDREIVADFVNRIEIYLTKKHNNLAFVGHDENCRPRCIALRGTEGHFKNTTAGSDRRYPFQTRSEEWDVRNNVVHLFEAPIDLLSYATLMKRMGMDYKTQNMIALCGIYQPAKKLEDSKLPVALLNHFEECPYTKTVCLHLDNDGPGVIAAKTIKYLLEKAGYKVFNQPPPKPFKDCNEFLIYGDHGRHPEQEKEVIR